jgi:polygalacturonase
MTTRRGFLGSLLALAAAPAIAGFVPTPVSVAIGRTDSTRAFQQAIDAAAGSGTVHFPAGTYRIRHSNYF